VTAPGISGDRARQLLAALAHTVGGTLVIPEKSLREVSTGGIVTIEGLDPHRDAVVLSLARNFGDPEYPTIITGEYDAEPSPLAGVPLTAHVDPPRLHTLALPDGRFVLVVTGGGLPDGDYDTLRNLGKTVGAADVAVFVGHMEVR
jgi:hypothetical protein